MNKIKKEDEKAAAYDDKCIRNENVKLYLVYFLKIITTDTEVLKLITVYMSLLGGIRTPLLYIKCYILSCYTFVSLLPSWTSV